MGGLVTSTLLNLVVVPAGYAIVFRLAKSERATRPSDAGGTVDPDAVRAAITAAGGTSAGAKGAEWIEAVRQQTGSDAAGSLVTELGVESIKVEDDDKLPRYMVPRYLELRDVLPKSPSEKVQKHKLIGWW